MLLIERQHIGLVGQDVGSNSPKYSQVMQRQKHNRFGRAALMLFNCWQNRFPFLLVAASPNFPSSFLFSVVMEADAMKTFTSHTVVRQDGTTHFKAVLTKCIQHHVWLSFWAMRVGHWATATMEGGGAGTRWSKQVCYTILAASGTAFWNRVLDTASHHREHEETPKPAGFLHHQGTDRGQR